LAISIILTYIFRELLSGEPTPALPLAYFLGLAALYSYLQLNSLAQPIIGLKLAIPLLLGASLYKAIFSNWEQFRTWLYLVWLASIIGICINYFTAMPWAGSTFQGALGESTVSREWTTAGIVRLSGFSRASYDAAAICAIGACVFLVDERFAKLARAIGFLIATIAVGLTTSKGPLLALAVITMWFFYKSFINKSEHMGVGIFGLAAAAFMIPPLTAIYNLRLENSAFILSSFAERVNSMWPSAYSNIENFVQFFLGRGLGGIGFAQFFGEPLKYNAADNFAVYIYISFGLVGIALFFFTLTKFRSRANSDHADKKHLNLSLRSCLIFWIISGYVSNMYEQPLLSFYFGMFIGFSFIKNEIHKRRSQ